MVSHFPHEEWFFPLRRRSSQGLRFGQGKLTSCRSLTLHLGNDNRNNVLYAVEGYVLSDTGASETSQESKYMNELIHVCVPFKRISLHVIVPICVQNLIGLT